ncbi:nuclear transport factor 2 family protein [Actinoallomurus sp. NPDC050550]|uniref:nuclear transport factor 2 family protein n=1 Tax=Actinoallomurus sp. NPDC050550 TaxID=3154937 RepID=UPI0033C6D062
MDITSAVRTSGSGGSVDTKLERNKRNVLAFYEVAINDKDFAAASRLIGDRYVQHNPSIADGAEGLERRIEFMKKAFPELRAEIKNIFAEGDFVIGHVHGVRVPGERGTAIVDIFRLDENGRLIEHWDVMQDLPEEAANENGIF